MRVQGFTLVELIVALVIFELLLLGGVGAIHLAARHAARAEVTEQALWAAGSLLDSLSTRRTGSQRPTAWGWVELDSDHVLARDSTGRLLVALRVPR